MHSSNTLTLTWYVKNVYDCIVNFEKLLFTTKETQTSKTFTEQQITEIAVLQFQNYFESRI